MSPSGTEGGRPPRGVLMYTEDQVAECLGRFSSEFTLNGADALIESAFRIARELSRSGAPTGDGERYRVYLKLCEAAGCEPRNPEDVLDDQDAWFRDPSIDVDPVAVLALKALLWSRHASAPDGTMDRKCPVCGSDPDFFYIDGDGRLHLVCSRCDYEWRYLRTGCPFCGGNDPRDISYLISDDGFSRLRRCSKCGRSMFGVDERRARRPFCYFLEKLLTGYALSIVNADRNGPSPGDPTSDPDTGRK